MSDCSSDIAQRIRQKQHREQIEKERVVREERLLWERARALWDKLRKTLMEECAEFYGCLQIPAHCRPNCTKNSL